MRKITKAVLTITVVMGTAIFVWAKTKKEQKKAQNGGRHVPYGPYEALFKRPLDAIAAGTALVLLAPVIGVIALLVRVKIGSPVLFMQERPGKDKKIFTLYKFRSMTNEKDEKGELLPDEKRLTKFGKWLRSTSLDELPELLNILKGDMSIVGPRPLLVKYLDRYTPIQCRRQEVRPGLTGLAMATVRNSAGWDKKFELDIEYVDKISFLFDLKIIFWTIKIVLKREGINETGEATNSEFMGVLKEQK